MAKTFLYCYKLYTGIKGMGIYYKEKSMYAFCIKISISFIAFFSHSFKVCC